MGEPPTCPIVKIITLNFFQTQDFAALGAYIMAYIRVLVPSVAYLMCSVTSQMHQDLSYYYARVSGPVRERRADGDCALLFHLSVHAHRKFGG